MPTAPSPAPRMEGTPGALASLLLWLFLPVASQALPPPNDDLANALRLSGEATTVEASTLEATTGAWEAMGTASSPGHGRRVWYVWRAPRDGALRVTVGSRDGFPSVVIFPGYSPGPTTSGPLSTPDGMPDFNEVFLPVIAGKDYWMAAGLENGVGGRIVLGVEFLEEAANNTFASRLPLPPEGVQLRIATTAPILSVGRGDQDIGGAHWYSWKPSQAGLWTLRVSPLAKRSQSAALLSLYTGDDHATLKPVVTSLPAPGSLRWGPAESQARFMAEAGTTYALAIRPLTTHSIVPMELDIHPGQPPAVALIAPGDDTRVRGGHPLGFAAQAAAHQAPIARVEFLVENEMQRLWTLVATQPPWVAELPASEVLAMNHQVLARVVDANGLVAWSRSVSLKPHYDPGGNDALADAHALPGDFHRIDVPIANWTREPGEPGSSSQTAWWSWKPVHDGPFCVQMRGVHEAYTRQLSVNVYTMDRPGVLTSLEPLTDPGGNVWMCRRDTLYWIQAGLPWPAGQMPASLEIFPTVALPGIDQASVTSGDPLALHPESRDMSGTALIRVLANEREIASFTTPPFLSTATLTNDWTDEIPFRLAVETLDHQGGRWIRNAGRLSVKARPPENDDFIRARELPAEVRLFSGNCMGATLEVGEVADRWSTIWWRWVPAESGPFLLHEDLQSSSTLLEVFEGETLATLRSVGRRIIHPISGRSVTAFQARAGRVYHLRASSSSRQPFTLRLLPGALPDITLHLPSDSWLVTNRVTLEARVTGPDNGISEVRFFDGQALIGSVSEPPYQIDWDFSSQGRFGDVFLSATFLDQLGYEVRSMKLFALLLPSAPENAGFSNPQHLEGLTPGTTGTTLGAFITLDNSPPGFWNLGNHAVWYEWVAPVSGSFTLRARSDAALDGLTLALFRAAGEEFEQLPLEIFRNEGGASAWSSWTTRAGDLYRIAVISKGQSGGPFALRITSLPPPTLGIESPPHGWVQERAAPLNIRIETTHPEDLDGPVEFLVLRGDGVRKAIGQLEPGETAARLALPELLTREGESATWQLVARARDRQGTPIESSPVSITVTEPRPLATNDAFDRRVTLEGTLLDWFLPQERLTLEEGERPPTDWRGMRVSAWWTWTAQAGGVAVVGSRYGVVEIFTGSRVDQLSPVEPLPGQIRSTALFRVEAGVSYQIRAHGNPGAPIQLLLDSRKPSLSQRGESLILRMDTTLETLWKLESSTNLMDWTPAGTAVSRNGFFDFNTPFPAAIPSVFYRISPGP